MAKIKRKGKRPILPMTDGEYVRLKREIDTAMNWNYRSGWIYDSKEWKTMVREKIPNYEQRRSFCSIAGKHGNAVKQELSASREKKAGQLFLKF